jgi:hypothetical protein
MCVKLRTIQISNAKNRKNTANPMSLLSFIAAAGPYHP